MGSKLVITNSIPSVLYIIIPFRSARRWDRGSGKDSCMHGAGGGWGGGKRGRRIGDAEGLGGETRFT